LNETDLLISNARERLKSAYILFGCYADAVSRAYHSMFFGAKALLLKREIYPRTHRGLISQFSLELVKNQGFPRDLFDLLTRAQEEREEADYGFQIDIDRKEADLIVNGAQKFLDECEKYLS